jgi:hypothetical protein
MKNKLLFLWELPQNILGLILLIFYNSKIEKHDGRYFIFDYRFNGGMSLGHFIFCRYKNEELMSHEWGHTYQSRWLGPLYLIIIGLPSITWSFIYDYFTENYDAFIIEKWATNLGKKYLKYGKF